MKGHLTDQPSRLRAHFIFLREEDESLPTGQNVLREKGSLLPQLYSLGPSPNVGLWAGFVVSTSRSDHVLSTVGTAQAYSH